MAQIDEANIQTTVVCFKKRYLMSGQLPVKVSLVQDNRDLSERAWRLCAIEYLEREERLKQKKETLHL